MGSLFLVSFCCFSVSMLCPTLRPHGLQHTRLPWPLLSPGLYSHSCPLCQWCCPTPSHHLFPSSPPALNLSQHQGFSNELALCIRWPNYWSFSFSISTSNEYSRLISFRIDWFDLLAVQGTLKSLLQHHNSTASSLWLSAFFMVQLAYRYTSTGTNHSFDYTDLCWQRDLSAF